MNSPNLSNNSTSDLFGSIIDVYTRKDALEDGVYTKFGCDRLLFRVHQITYRQMFGVDKRSLTKTDLVSDLFVRSLS